MFVYFFEIPRGHNFVYHSPSCCSFDWMVKQDILPVYLSRLKFKHYQNTIQTANVLQTHQ
jgi:hypothetical protein